MLELHTEMKIESTYKHFSNRIFILICQGLNNIAATFLYKIINNA